MDWLISYQSIEIEQQQLAAKSQIPPNHVIIETIVVYLYY